MFHKLNLFDILSSMVELGWNTFSGQASLLGLICSCIKFVMLSSPSGYHLVSSDAKSFAALLRHHNETLLL